MCEPIEQMNEDINYKSWVTASRGRQSKRLALWWMLVILVNLCNVFFGFEGLIGFNFRFL